MTFCCLGCRSVSTSFKNQHRDIVEEMPSPHPLLPVNQQLWLSLHNSFFEEFGSAFVTFEPSESPHGALTQSLVEVSRDRIHG